MCCRGPFKSEYTKEQFEPLPRELDSHMSHILQGGPTCAGVRQSHLCHKPSRFSSLVSGQWGTVGCTTNSSDNLFCNSFTPETQPHASMEAGRWCAASY